MIAIFIAMVCEAVGIGISAISGNWSSMAWAIVALLWTIDVFLRETRK